MIDPLGSSTHVMFCTVSLPVFLGVRRTEDGPSRSHRQSRSDPSISSEQVNSKRRELAPSLLIGWRERSRQAVRSVRSWGVSVKRSVSGQLLPRELGIGNWLCRGERINKKKIAPSHSIPSSARAISGGRNVKPTAFGPEI